MAGLDSVTYADRLVRAWGSGDRAAAGCYATGSVAAALFAQADPGGVHWRRTGSQGAAGTIYVTYDDNARGGTLTVGVQNLSREAGGWHAAYTERFQNEPRAWGPIDWSDNLVRAWGRGDRTQTAYYATPDVVHTLFAFASPGGGGWQRVRSEGTAGTLYVTYRNVTTGHLLIGGVCTVRLSQGHAHAAHRVSIS